MPARCLQSCTSYATHATRRETRAAKKLPRLPTDGASVPVRGPCASTSVAKRRDPRFSSSWNAIRSPLRLCSPVWVQKSGFRLAPSNGAAGENWCQATKTGRVCFALDCMRSFHLALLVSCDETPDREIERGSGYDTEDHLTTRLQVKCCTRVTEKPGEEAAVCQQDVMTEESLSQTRYRRTGNPVTSGKRQVTRGKERRWKRCVRRS